jgi:hypothetical protein
MAKKVNVERNEFKAKLTTWQKKVLASYGGFCDTRMMLEEIDNIIADGFGSEKILGHDEKH